MAGVFEGVRVLDLSWGIAGPMTTMLLADNGAEVTRIEPPDGDPFRDQTGYRVWHRGKRSARLDLGSEDGRQTFMALARSADVVVDSFSPGTSTRLGVDHESLSRINPRVVTCSITGYGDHPQHRDRPGYDGLVAARTGLLYDQKGRRGSAMEYICGRPGPHPEFDGPEGLVRGADREGPVFPRTPWPSIGATYFATLGIAAALRAREVSGEGQRVATSLLQGALAAASLNWQRVDNPDAPLYWMWPVDSRSIEGIYQCADDRWVHHWTVRPRWVLASAENGALGSVELDSTYRDDPDRVSMEPDGLLTGIFLHPLLTEAFKKFPSAAWEKAAEAAGIGVATVRSPGEALADESYLADGCVVELEDPDVGRIRHVGPLLEFSATPGEVSGPAPRSGEHTTEVRAEAERAEARPATASHRHPEGGLAHPLQGIRVLDLGLGVAGPYTGRVLADLGADVIKVHALHDTYWAGTHMGLGTNRGKRSIALNLKDKGGLDAMEHLIETADVVTTNWRPGAAARLGLDDDTLRERHPGLIYCNTRGYEKGPRSALPGTDQTAAALSGTEWEDGACDAGNPPLWSRSNMGDTGNALLAAIAIVAALYHREKTGEGQAVSTSIVNAGLLHTSYAWIHADGTPADWGHVDGDQYGLSPYYRLYQCSDDDWLFLAAVSEPARARLRAVIGELEGVSGNARREADLLESRFRSRTVAEWFARLDQGGVPVEIVDEGFCRSIFDDPEARASQLVAETWSGSVGRFEDPGLLINMSPAECVIQRGPSMCGEHSREILLEHGYSDEEVDDLVAEGAVLDGAPEPW
ncbi:MAG TPA: CoA transferase [Acidimicrobiales bacterium]|nr:CoA transferase [Acidimicrobiales bacterium]